VVSPQFGGDAEAERETVQSPKVACFVKYLVCSQDTSIEIELFL
jgi:hypothetical protein